jgi:subtilisin-like proprotein convertase family protein
VGVSHVLSVPQSGRIKRLTVSVDIQHTFIGDLRVTLKSPAGKNVVLHNRSGGNQHDLIANYRSEDVPGLAGLLGDQAQGNWTLHIADLAGVDVGKLRRWSLEFELETSAQTIQKEVSPAVTIPDNNPAGVSSSIAIAQSGAVQGVKVSVDITHTWIGDLRVELVAPSGQSALLHDQSGRDEDNLIRSYDSVTSPALAALAGQAVQGNWVLRVKDLAAQDIGKLNKWSLELTL